MQALPAAGPVKKFTCQEADAIEGATGTISPRKIILIYAVFALVAVAANRIALAVCVVNTFDCPPFYPFSVFYPRIPEFNHIITALAVTAFFGLAQHWLRRNHLPLPFVIAGGLLLVLGSNGIQGFERGFAVPIAGEPLRWTLEPGGHEYYHDALNVIDPVQFVADFEQLQPGLNLHAKTHPPGAVLTLWALVQITPDPAAIGILTALLSVVLLAWWLYAILRTEFDAQASGCGVWLFLLIPAVQIYSAASLDAIIAALFTGALYGLGFARSPRGWVVGSVCLLLASWLTFAFLLLIPVLAVHQYRWGELKRLIAPLLALALVYSILYTVLGFNYLSAFHYASLHENPDGLRLLAQPVEYLFTRLENVLEIAIFFSPILCVLAAKGIRAPASLSALTVAAVVVLTAMFASGAFRTGETARACLFIYPYLLFPALDAVRQESVLPRALAWLVFGQSVVMQLFGGYFW